MRKSIIFAAVLVAATVSCQKEMIQAPEQTGNFTIKATREAYAGSDTKASIDADGKFTWSSGDAIGIWTGESFEKMSTTDDKVAAATFSGTLEGTPSYCAVFPYSLNARRNSGVYVTLPASYEWKEGEVCTPMLAQYANTLSFKHLGGVVKVTLKNVPANAVKFVFNTDYDITGEYLINYNQDTFSQEIVMNKTATNNQVTYTFTLTEARDMVFYVPVPVGEYKFGFTLYDVDGKQILNKQGTTANTVSRAVLLEMPALICDDGGSIVTAEEYLQKKLDAGGTVTLDDDYTGNFTVSGTVTLDLNGHKISTSEYAPAIKVVSGGNLTVNGGESGKISSEAYYTFINEGTLTINDGIYKASEDLVISNEGTATLNGGSYTGQYGAVANCQGATLTVNGGNYERVVSDEGVENQFAISNLLGDITFGKAISYTSKYSLCMTATPEAGHLYFGDGVSLSMVYMTTLEGSEVRSYVADGAALKQALENADVNSVILNQNFTLTESITISSDKVLDLDFHTLTYTGGGSDAQCIAFRVKSGTFTVTGIKDITYDEDGNGTTNAQSGITATGNSDTERHIFWANGGKIVLEGDTVYKLGECTTNATNYSIVYVDNNGTVEISDGVFDQGSTNKNILDIGDTGGTISLTGGKFWYYDPSDFVADGYKSQYVPGEDDDLGNDYYLVVSKTSGGGSGDGTGGESGEGEGAAGGDEEGGAAAG